MSPLLSHLFAHILISTLLRFCLWLQGRRSAHGWAGLSKESSQSEGGHAVAKSQAQRSWLLHRAHRLVCDAVRTALIDQHLPTCRSHAVLSLIGSHFAALVLWQLIQCRTAECFGAFAARHTMLAKPHKRHSHLACVSICRLVTIR